MHTRSSDSLPEQKDKQEPSTNAKSAALSFPAHINQQTFSDITSVAIYMQQLVYSEQLQEETRCLLGGQLRCLHLSMSCVIEAS